MTRLRLTLLILTTLSLGSIHHRGATAQEPLEADAPNQAGLVVEFGDGSLFTTCVAFYENNITGYDLLTRSGLGVEAAFDPSQGAAICKIGSEGCPADDCFCAMPDYWSYWNLGDGGWNYSGAGASNNRVGDGEVDGWSWGAGNPPPVVTFSQICAPLVSDTPVPLPTDTPVPPSPTSQPPTDTPLPPTQEPEPTDTDVPDTDTPPPPAPLLPTHTPEPSATPVPATTAAPSATLLPSATPTPAATFTLTPEQPTQTPTSLPSETPTSAPTATPRPASLPTDTAASQPTTKSGPTSTGYVVFAVLVVALGLGLVRIARTRGRP